MPNEHLTLDQSGKESRQPGSTIELPAGGRPPCSISERELLKRITLAPYRIPGEERNAENEDEIPPFAPIPDRKPGELMEEITKEDIKLRKGLTSTQQKEIVNHR